MCVGKVKTQNIYVFQLNPALLPLTLTVVKGEKNAEIVLEKSPVKEVSCEMLSHRNSSKNFKVRATENLIPCIITWSKSEGVKRTYV